MLTIKQSIAGLLATLALVLGGYLAVNQGVPDVSFGALTGPDIASPYLRWGGVPLFHASEPMASATTTVCAFRGPASTSTLDKFTANFVVSSTSASTLTLALGASTDAQPSATSSTVLPLSASSISANAQAFVTSTTSSSAQVVGPNQWVLLSMKGGSGTFSPTGVCQARFEGLAAF